MLAIIPARGGSKRIPKKNILPLAGKPLITYSIAAARAAETIERVIVSTDDKEIAERAREVGAEVPFLRPAELGEDRITARAACLHVVDTLAEIEGKVHESVVHIQPTSPLIAPEDIDAAVRHYQEGDFTAVVGITPARMHVEGVLEFDNKRHLKTVLERSYGVKPRIGPSQLHGQRYEITGSVSVLLADSLRINVNYIFFDSKVSGVVIPNERALDIDTWFDVKLAECLILNGFPKSEKN